MARELFDIEIEEITLCKSPANRKKFFIKKMKEGKTMSEFIDKLKKFLAESDEDIDTALTTEQVERIEKFDKETQKEIEDNLDIVSQYEDIPDELESVHQFLFKQVINVPEVEVDKAGAKLSKTTQAALKEIRALVEGSPKAIEKLDTLLGVEPKKTKKKEGDNEENLSEETVAKLERLEEFEKKENEELKKEEAIKQQEKIVETVNKALKDAGLDEIPKKKSIDSDEEEGKDTKKKAADDDEDKFPSIPIPVLGS